MSIPMSLKHLRLLLATALLGVAAFAQNPAQLAAFPYVCAPCDQNLKTSGNQTPPTEGDTRMVAKGDYRFAEEIPDYPSSYPKSSFARYYTIPMKRVVTSDANLDSGGNLINAQAMVDSGVISKWAILEFPVARFDTSVFSTPVKGKILVNDYGWGYTYLTFNGHNLATPDAATGYDPSVNFKPGEFGKVMGTSNEYRMVSLKVPIAWVNFPKRGVLGINNGEPVAANNYLAITAHGWGWGGTVPPTRTDIPWISLKFGAMAPIFLVHGTNATPATWNEPIQPSGEPFVPDVALNYQVSFNDYFDPAPNDYVQGERSLGICFNDIILHPNGAIEGNRGNSELLAQQITDRLKSVGAKACHLIAHSKGGIDSRAMIRKHYDINHFNEQLDQPGHFEILSLYTLDTPHRGTILSDIAWNKLNNPNPMADPNWPGLQTLMSWDLSIMHWTGIGGASDDYASLPTGPALEAQKTQNMANWNKGNPFDFNHKNAKGKSIRFYNTASDADWNRRNGSIDALEKAHMVPLESVATAMYQMLYWAKEVDAQSGGTREVNQGTGEWRHTVTIPLTELFVPTKHDPGQWNDLCVIYSSAVYDGGTLFCPPYLQNFNKINFKNHSSVKNYGMARGIVAQIALDWPVTAP